MSLDPFLVRALLAGLGLSLLAAPLGCFLVWQRMAFFGETVAQACLIGVAVALAFDFSVTGGSLVVALLSAWLLLLLSRQRLVPVDSILSLLAHSALALGVLATALVKGRPVDLMGYLFGDIFSVTREDLAWLVGCAVIVALVLWRLWQPLLRLAVHEELAAAEGVDRDRVRGSFVLVLALVIAIAMKIVGILLTVAFLIIPAAAARPLADTPERMVVFTAGIAVCGVAAGLMLSLDLDTPGGPSIVVVLSAIAAVSLTIGQRRRLR